MVKVFTAVALLLLVLVPVTSALAACDGAPDRSGPVSIEVGSLARFFLVKVPSASDGRTPAPVLFALHQFGMNAQYMESRVSSRVWPEAIMVYPEGARGAGGPAWQGRPGDSGDRGRRTGTG